MATIPTTEPTSFTAGDLVRCTRKDLSGNYPATTYTLKYYLVNSAGQIAITASADGVYFSVSLATSTTAAYTAGKYHWQATVEKSGERFVVDSGTMEILPNFEAQTSGYDARTSAQTIFEAVEAVLEGRATQDQESYSIQGRALSRTPIPDLLLLRNHFAAIWEQEKRAEKLNNGDDSRNRIKVRFKRA